MTAAGIVTVSDPLAKKLDKFLKRDNIYVIENAFDLESIVMCYQ